MISCFRRRRRGRRAPARRGSRAGCDSPRRGGTLTNGVQRLAGEAGFASRGEDPAAVGAPAVDLALHVGDVDLGHPVAVDVADRDRARIAPPRRCRPSPTGRRGCAGWSDGARRRARASPAARCRRARSRGRSRRSRRTMSSLRLSPSRSARTGEDSPSAVPVPATIWPRRSPRGKPASASRRDAGRPCGGRLRSSGRRRGVAWTTTSMVNACGAVLGRPLPSAGAACGSRPGEVGRGREPRAQRGRARPARGRRCGRPRGPSSRRTTRPATGVKSPVGAVAVVRILARRHVQLARVVRAAREYLAVDLERRAHRSRPARTTAAR